MIQQVKKEIVSNKNLPIFSRKFSSSKESSSTGSIASGFGRECNRNNNQFLQSYERIEDTQVNNRGLIPNESRVSKNII